jgi:hypothetical protein
MQAYKYYFIIYTAGHFTKLNTIVEHIADFLRNTHHLIN